MRFIKSVLPLIMLAVIGVSALVITATTPVSAIEVFDTCSTQTDSAVCDSTNTDALFREGDGIFTRIINILLFLIGAIAVIMIIVGAIRYVVSAGDQSQLTAAKNTILYAVVGLVIAFFAYGIVNFVVVNIV